MSKGNSKVVTTNQQGIHQNLLHTVQRHLDHPSQKPYSEHTQQAFMHAKAWLANKTGRIILDACCGTGESTEIIAAMYPDCWVVGVDKSIHRLERHTGSGSNYLLVQADLQDFWRLARQDQWQLYKHYLLYPNPYPKSVHYKRRWHASPALVDIIALGGELIVRSNWQLYIEEFVAALSVANVASQCEPYHSATPMTAFERKYWLSGQSSWQLVATL